MMLPRRMIVGVCNDAIANTLAEFHSRYSVSGSASRTGDNCGGPGREMNNGLIGSRSNVSCLSLSLYHESI
jgi:hypothetical protein